LLNHWDHNQPDYDNIHIDVKMLSLTPLEVNEIMKDLSLNPKNMAYFFAFSVLGVLLISSAVVKPAGSKSVLRTTDNPALKLESLVVDVNGERRRVEPAAGITVVRGDLVTVIEAWLVDKSKPVAQVDIAGFKSRSQRNLTDERGIVIDTARDLEPRQSEGGLGAEYLIRASGSGVFFGETKIKIENPKLVSFEIEVNGKRQVLTDGARIRLSPQDGIKVISIQTNVRGNENVRYDLNQSKDPSGRAVRELRFKRGEFIFAKIPVDWLGS
jgi:hypothetical protein